MSTARVDEQRKRDRGVSAEINSPTLHGGQTRSHECRTSADKGAGLCALAEYSFQDNDNRNQGVGLSLALDL